MHSSVKCHWRIPLSPVQVKITEFKTLWIVKVVILFSSVKEPSIHSHYNRKPSTDPSPPKLAESTNCVRTIDYQSSKGSLKSSFHIWFPSPFGAAATFANIFGSGICKTPVPNDKSGYSTLRISEWASGGNLSESY